MIRVAQGEATQGGIEFDEETGEITRDPADEDEALGDDPPGVDDQEGGVEE